MKIAIGQLKQLIKEQIKEAGELAAAGKGATIRHSQSAIDRQGTPPPGSIELDPRDPVTPGKSLRTRQRNPYTGTGREHEWELAQSSLYPVADLEEQIEETVQESIRKMVKEAIRQHLNEKKKEAINSLDVYGRHQLKICKDTLKMHPAMAGVMGGPSKEEAEAKLRNKFGYSDEQIEAIKNDSFEQVANEDNLNLIKEAIKQALNEKAKSDPKWLSKAGKAIAKKGTKGVLHKDLGVAKGKKIPVATLNKKKSNLQKKGEGDKKMSAEDRKELQRVQFAINAKKAKK